MKLYVELSAKRLGTGQLLIAVAALCACGGGGGSGSALPPTVNLALNPARVLLGSSSTLSWSSTNASSCTATGAWSGIQAAQGSLIETPTTAGTQTYTLSCTGSGGTASSSATLTVTAANATLSGKVLDGINPIAGAAVTVYASGNTSAIGSGSSDGSGQFSFGFLNPGNQALLYVVATGGNAGAGANAAIKLLTVLGPAADISSSPSVTVNELTTVASAWALAQFLEQDTAVSGPAASLAIAAGTAANLANARTGAAATAIQAGANSADKLDSLANLLAGCVNSAGASSSPCAALFSNTTAAGAAAPTDTLAAALFIARHPASNVAMLYTLAAGNSAYSPALGSAPNDWTLSLNYTGGGMSEPTQVALDAAGNVWIANYNNAVSQFSPTGTALSPASGYTGGGLQESFGLAVDASGNIWVCNEQSASSVNGGGGSITELSSGGVVLSGPNGYSGGGLDFPDTIAIDTAGHVWTGNYGNSTLSEFSSGGAALSPSAGYTGGGLEFPTGIAFDGLGNLWIADNGANQVSEFSPSGTALSPASGYSGGGIRGPQAVALDPQGNVWVANYYGDNVSELDPHGNPLSPSTGYTGGGLAAPGGIAVDGAGNVWITNYNGNSLTALAGADTTTPGTMLSPPTGFVGTGLLQPFSPAIDSAGNLWTANFGNDSLTEFVGVAAPVVMPLLGPPHPP